MGWLEALGYGFKFVTLLMGVFKSKPGSDVKEAKAKLDQALSKAKKENDLTELSKWFGGHI